MYEWFNTTMKNTAGWAAENAETITHTISGGAIGAAGGAVAGAATWASIGGVGVTLLGTGFALPFVAAGAVGGAALGLSAGLVYSLLEQSGRNHEGQETAFENGAGI
jgi:hypothetical protein